jgi:hypothetical protein
MTKDEIVKKNISLSFDFIRYVINHPEILDKVPDGAEIEFFEPDLPMPTSEKRISDSAKSVFRVDHTFRQLFE